MAKCFSAGQKISDNSLTLLMLPPRYFVARLARKFARITKSKSVWSEGGLQYD